MNSNDKIIWDYLIKEGLSKNGAAGLIGNLKAESNLNPRIYENKYKGTIGLTDEEYINKVDNGEYTNFIHDKVGFGLAQWTYYTRKENFLNYVKEKNSSIGDLEIQLEFLMKELKSNYSQILEFLKDNNHSIRECSDIVLTQFERPKNQSEGVQLLKCNYGIDFYNKYNPDSKIEKNYLNSIDKIALRVIKGEYGNGETRKIKLMNEGYDYQIVQKRVNELLSS